MQNRGYEILGTIKKLHEEMKQNFESKFKELNITGTQGMMVGILHHSKILKISELSEKMGLSNSTVSGIVDRLEKQNVVERIRSETDRRVVSVKLTEQFKNLAKDHFNNMDQFFNQLMSKATEEEMDQILTGFKLLENIIERASEENDD
ncbi:MAG: MarR family transcriptional regulator [Clostridiales bacterium]|nr:MarR family transcriptional regulator [Clostridiales bacterium]